MSGHYLYVLSHDVHNSEVLFIKDGKKQINNKFLYFFYRLHKLRINDIIRLPYKNIWFKYLVPSHLVDKNEQLCFVFSPSTTLSYGEDFVRYVRKKFNNSKVVLVIGDKIESYGKSFDIEKLKKEMDFVCTYNPIDANKYGIALHPSMVYNITVDNPIPFEQRTTDVFFLGQEKGRGDKIVEIYRKCVELGLRSEFYIVGKTNNSHINGINYCDWISYQDLFEKLKNTKCIINLLQPGASGFTFRDNEAYNHGCFLITNNPIDDLKYIFNEGQVIKIDSLNAETANMIKNRKKQFPKKENKFSMDNFYSWIEKSL